MKPALVVLLASALGGFGCEREALGPEAGHQPASPHPTVTAAARAEPVAPRTDPVAGTDEPLAVLELFTSEGCSSCPPADEVLASVTDEASRKRLNVITLELHVDYWDDLGWADPFSAPTYSERQRAYATKLNLSEIYTPQLVVNGKWQLVGSSRGELDRVLTRALANPAPYRVDASARSGNAPNEVRVDYETTAAGGPGRTVAVALVQDRAETHVSAGENARRTLEHRHVVRALKVGSLNGSRGTLVATWPAGAVPAGALAVVLVSDRETGAILGARSVRVCGTAPC